MFGRISHDFLMMQVKSPHCKIAPINIAPTFIEIAPID
jgi:hypothetical protein